MINMIKKNKYQIIELVLIFFITLIFNLLCSKVTLDEIWNYGFSYNISKGLTPYKDFNLVITPLYSILGAVFMLIFGKNIITYYIFNSIICTIIFYYIKKFNYKNYYISYALLLPFSLPNYNLFCILLLYILMNLENKKSNDYLIGLILGLTFLTKQNIGIYLCIPTLFTKNIKKIIKRVIGFIMPNIILLIYLLMNSCLSEFINYTILGVNDFLEDNMNINFNYLIITSILIIYLIYKYIKTKDIKLIYLICFQGISFPIVDIYHVMIPFIPVFTYFIKKININKKIIISGFTIFIIFIFSYNIYLCTTTNYSYPNNLTVYKYRKIDSSTVKFTNKINKYIKELEGRVFIINMFSYLIKLENNTPINKYDLLNNGNLGKDGEYKIINEIDEICQKEKCTFLLNKNEINNQISQYNQEILKYIYNTYNEIGIIEGLTIYKNY